MGIGRPIIWIAIMAAQGTALPAGNPGELALTVVVYDDSSVPAFELRNAMSVAQMVFGYSGIATHWLQCATSESTLRSSCPEALSATAVVLHIVRRAPAGLADRGDRLGTALYDAEGQAGTIAYVFEERLEEIAPFRDHRRFRVLGYVMAHEVGHLLLGSGSHSESGIMQPRWGVWQMVQRAGYVTFTPEQAQRITVNLKARMHSESNQAWCRPAYARQDVIRARTKLPVWPK